MITDALPKVSIIVPVYNAGEHLRPCMDTLINQTLREIEIVCVLDCPTDGSDAIVEEYAAKDERIVVVRNKQNLNIGESRNVGLCVACGEYIGFSDHDDTRELDMYEKLYEATDNQSKAVVFSGKIVSVIHENCVSSFLHQEISEREFPIYQRAFLSFLPRVGRKFEGRGHITPNLYQRSFLNEHKLKFVDSNKCYGEDILFNMDLLSYVQSDSEIGLIQHDYYKYLLHGENTHLASWFSDGPHVVQHVHTMSDIISRVPYGKEITNQLIFIILICLIYTWFRRNIRSNGFNNTIRLLKEIINSDLVCLEIINKTPMPRYGFSLPKRLFALWMKQMFYT